ncbi:MAG TPA: hypothetical protein DIV46_10470 [Verrucomicrobiales bacterium]|nr:hypothetical protein [Verrucomicrobiales bacterium]
MVQCDEYFATKDEEGCAFEVGWRHHVLARAKNPIILGGLSLDPLLTQVSREIATIRTFSAKRLELATGN